MLNFEHIHKSDSRKEKLCGSLNHSIQNTFSLCGRSYKQSYQRYMFMTLNTQFFIFIFIFCTLNTCTKLLHNVLKIYNVTKE